MDKGTIKYIKTNDGVNHPIEATTLDGKGKDDYQKISNIVTSVNSNSADTKYPSAKCVWTIVGDLSII